MKINMFNSSRCPRSRFQRRHCPFLEAAPIARATGDKITGDKKSPVPSSRTILTMLSRCVLASTVTLLVGCVDDSGSEEGTIATIEQALIGGQPATADYFRSTVGIGDECTAAKVGPRLFLTAAHCVAVPRLYRQGPPPGYPANDGVDEAYVAGQPLLIQWGLDENGPSGTFTIVETSIHPSWWANPGSSDPTLDSTSAADIAVIEIAEETPDIPEARVEMDAIAPGTPVVEVGRGCEVSTSTPDEHLGRFKAQDTTTLPPEPELVYVQPPLSESQTTAIKGSYLFTPGQTQDPNASSLCLGDSGGPLYLSDNRDPRVVGVNSDYVFTDGSGVSWSDWHTQTALGSFHGVGEWLVGLGVNTVSTPWNLDRIDQREPTPKDGYHYDGDGTGVHVYILDSGIRATHEQFEGRVGEGWDFVDGDADPDDVGPLSHGTGVASVIGGKDLGVAKNVTLHALRVLNQRNSGNEADVVDALQWVIQNHISPAVINMSFTTPIDDDEMAHAVQQAIDAGIVVVASAGNTGEDACNYYPAGFPGVITVGASDQSDNRFDSDGFESNIGSCVDLFAPGVDVELAGNWDDSAMSTGSGTTEAAPHVAGAAAIYLGAHSTATPEEVAQAILSQATQGVLSNVGQDSPNLLLFTSELTSAPSCAETVYEAESMSASTGQAVTGGWNVWSNGYVQFDHSFPSGPSQFSVTARGEQGGGAWPNMTVTINGSLVYSTTVSSATWTDYTFDVSSVSGPAEVRVNFTNDYYANRQDRNLIVDKVTVDSCEGESGGDGCTVETAVDLGSDGHSVVVPTDGCVKVDSAYPSWWGMRHMMLQNNGGNAYPVPFGWSNVCQSRSGSGSFQTDWQSPVIGPVSDKCPTLIDLQGPSGGQITLRYFAN
jgi:hypothetical protein